MKIKNGEDQLRSIVGAFLTLILLLVTLVFTYSKVMVLYTVSDVTIVGNNSEGAFTDQDTFSADDGLFIAAALTEYDENTEVIEEKRYGELIIE